MKLVPILFTVSTLLLVGCHAKKEAAKQSDDLVLQDVQNKKTLPPPPPPPPIPPENSGNGIFTIVENMPEFPGGRQAADSFIYTNFTIPAEAEKVGASGKIYVEFIVDTTGTMTEIQILKDGVGFGCGETMLKVFKLMAATYKWTPGEQRNKKVAVRYRYPITIKAEDYDPITRKNTKYHTN